MFNELGKAMNHMKHEIRNYIIHMKKQNRLEAQLREEKLLNEKKDRALVESKLRKLHAKVDPHFLFNALNLVGKFAMLEEPEKAMEIYPHQLSVSSEQRIIIGRAFVMDPDLLLMDEPYGQMDIKLRFYLEDEVIVDLPRPRDVTAPEFIKLRRYVTEQIKWW